MSGNFCTLIPYLSLHSIPGGLLLMMQSPYPRVIWGNTANPVQSLSQCGWDWIPTPWAHSLLLVIGSWYPLSASFPHRGTLNSKPYTVSICTCTQGSKNLHIKPSLNIWFSVHSDVPLGFEAMSSIFYLSFQHVWNKNYNGILIRNIWWCINILLYFSFCMLKMLYMPYSYFTICNYAPKKNSLLEPWPEEQKSSFQKNLINLL